MSVFRSFLAPALAFTMVSTAAAACSNDSGEDLETLDPGPTENSDVSGAAPGESGVDPAQTTVEDAAAEGVAGAAAQGEKEGDATEQTPGANADNDESGDQVDGQGERTGLLLTGEPVAVGDDWDLDSHRFFVYGVEPDDRLTIRSGPGVSNASIGSFSPSVTDIEIFGEVVFVGVDENQTMWTPVVIGDGAGWVARRFLRPRASGPIETIGDVGGETLATAAVVVEALGSHAFLATLVGEQGLRISTDEYIDESDVVLSAQQLEAASADVLEWGSEDGSGEPIIRSIEEHFAHLGGLTALTSTEVVSVDSNVGYGNTINNIAEYYPGAIVVEYHFGGTEYYGQLDWSSVRLVLEDGPTGDLQLVAISEAQWTI